MVALASLAADRAEAETGSTLARPGRDDPDKDGGEDFVENFAKDFAKDFLGDLALVAVLATVFGAVFRPERPFLRLFMVPLVFFIKSIPYAGGLP